MLDISFCAALGFHTASGQNDQFPPANLSDGWGFSKQTLAGAGGNDEVAPWNEPALAGGARITAYALLAG